MREHGIKVKPFAMPYGGAALWAELLMATSLLLLVILLCVAKCMKLEGVLPMAQCGSMKETAARSADV